MIAVKRVRGADRDLAEVLLRRAEWLDREDRALLEQVLGCGVSTRAVADLTHVSRRTIQRRVLGLVRRLKDPQTLAVLRRHGRWPATTSAVALLVLVRGSTQRQAASELGMSLHEVRRHVERARALIELPDPQDPRL